MINSTKNSTNKRYSIYTIFVLVSVASAFINFSDAKYIKIVENPDGTTTHNIYFKVQYMNITRLCNGTKQILSVNGQFPGPTIYVRQRDHVNIKVTNHVNESVSIHWHGIRQFLTNWVDGPAYITQCPLKPGHHFTHSFSIKRQQGTLFWHAHLGWQRATLYGAFIIMPPKDKPYPFPIEPKADFPLLLGQSCEGPNNMSIGTSINNITFENPEISILQAYYQQTHLNVSAAILWETSLEETKSTYTEDFPSMPLFQYNYTNETLTNLQATFGTKVKVLEFNSNVQLVLQNTQNLFFESHPFHLHGYNFYVVGFGNGTYNPQKDPANFNLVDPPAMNTVGVPSGGWVALRFYTDNPGIWLMHCHFDMHVSWGMAMAFIVKEGQEANQKLPPPPKDYPSC